MVQAGFFEQDITPYYSGNLGGFGKRWKKSFCDMVKERASLQRRPGS